MQDREAETHQSEHQNHRERQAPYMVRQTVHFAPKPAPAHTTDPQMAEAFQAAHRVLPELVKELEHIAGPRTSMGRSFDMLPEKRPPRPVEKPAMEQPRPVEPAKNEQEDVQASDDESEPTVKKATTGSRLIMAMATVLFVVGTGVAVLGLRTNHEVKEQVKSAVTAQKSDAEGAMLPDSLPDEGSNPPSIDSYTTAASYPRVIRITKTATEARVLPLGTMANGALKAPGNIYDAGWYKESSKPGEAGAMVIDGHVSGPTKPGVFKKLSTLVKGDSIEIERGDGQKFTYTVMKVSLVDADKFDMSEVLVPIVQGKEGLNLITCGGKFNKTTGKYEQRTVVFAIRS